MSIIVTKRGEPPVRVERSPIEQEDHLQRTVYENFESIPLHEIKEGIRLLVLAREFPTGSGPIDALGIDGDGDIYVIETKLFKNADKRRVVAQMLDYGASLWSTYSDPAEFVLDVGRAVQTALGVPLPQRLTEFYDLAEEAEADEIIGSVQRNVSEGRFRFVVLMDRLDDRLRDVIRFVNQNSRFDILGVELDFYQHGEFEIVIPNLFGAEVRKEVGATAARPKHRWDEGRFFGAAGADLEPEVVGALRALYAWASERADAIAWGTGAHSGSFNVKVNAVHPTRSFLSAFTTGAVSLNFKWLTGDDVPAGTRAAIGRLADGLRANASLPLPPDVTDAHYTLRPEVWSPRVSEIVAELDDLVGA